MQMILIIQLCVPREYLVPSVVKFEINDIILSKIPKLHLY